MLSSLITHTQLRSMAAKGGQANGSNGFQKYMSLVKKSFEKKPHEGNGGYRRKLIE